MNSTDWWHLLAGIALFIFAMSLLEDSLKEIAGIQFKQFLKRQTSNKLRAIVSGTLVTAFLQSSSVVLLMVLSFVGAGVMSMRNALAVTLGANLGTTLDSWVVATIGFKVALDTIAYPLLAFTVLIKVLLPSNNNMKNLSNFIIGFALLFIGIEWMKTSVMGLVTGVDLSRYAHLSPYVFILVGILVTAIIQSSSATIAITLTALYHQVIPFESAACVVIGSEVGTTLKILLGSVGGIPDKKRVSLGNFIFNIVAVMLATLFLHPLIYFVRNLLSIKDPLIALVSFQSIINVITIFVFYPFVGKFADMLEKLYQLKDEEISTKYINYAEKQFPAILILSAEKETARLLKHAIRLNCATLGLTETENDNKSVMASLKKFAFEKTTSVDEYKKLKQLHGKILEFLVGQHTSDMNPEEIEQTGKLIATSRQIMHAAKNIKDIQHNILEVSTSENEVMHRFFIGLKDREKQFYSRLQLWLTSVETESEDMDTMSFVADIKTENAAIVDGILELLNVGDVDDYNSSTLLNMQREIYSSHKALLKVIESMKDLGMNAE